MTLTKFKPKPTLISLLITIILAGLLFRPGLWHLILYGIWQSIGNTNGEIAFIIVIDILLAGLIFAISYNILTGLKKKSNNRT